MKKKKLLKLRQWAQEHRTLVKFIISLLTFALAMIFFTAATSVLGSIPDGVQVGAAIILLMIAGFFFKGSIEIQDAYYEDRTALDIAARLEDRVAEMESEIFYLKHDRKTD